MTAQYFFNRGPGSNFAPQRTFGNVWRCLGLSQLWGGRLATGIQRVKARGAAEHPPVLRTAPSIPLKQRIESVSHSVGNGGDKVSPTPRVRQPVSLPHGAFSSSPRVGGQPMCPSWSAALVDIYWFLSYPVWRRQWHPTPVLLPGKSRGRRSLVGCSPWGREESDTTERHHFHFSLSCIVEGNGNPLQCSCLENPRDRGAWWAAIYGVAQDRT